MTVDERIAAMPIFTSHETDQTTSDRFRCSLIVCTAGALLLLFAVNLHAVALAQVSPEEHAKHHPEQADKSAGSKGEGGMMGGGMSGMMGGMMEKMGAPKPKEMYPRLMDLPDLQMEARGEIEQQAHQRMIEGTNLLSGGLDSLSSAAATNDFQTMQTATAKMREGLAQFESGLAAHRAIAEGQAPRNVALQWFKREMNLLPPAAAQTGLRVWGMDVFHTGVMFVLVAFSGTMIWMYFFKMRRASELMQRLAVDGAGQATLPSIVPPGTVSSPPGRAISFPTKPTKWSGQLHVASVFDETPSVKTFRLIDRDSGILPFSYLPGQFLTLTVLLDGKPVKRSYTIASSPTQRDYVEITVKREEQGLVSQYVHDRVQAGDDVSIAAPSGYFTFTGEDSDSIVLIAGGVGITPMMSVVRYLTDRCWSGDIFLIFCGRTPDEFIYREELEHLQRRHHNLHVIATMSRADEADWDGPRGRLTKDFIRGAVPKIESRHIHVCGPPTMMEATKAMLADLGVPQEQIKTENFGPATKPTLKPVASPAESSVLPTVTFCNSTKNAPLSPDQTILDAADELGIAIDNSCRSGTCGMCKVKMLEGEVEMECEDSLEPDEKADGIILACQAKSTGNVVIEA